MAEKPTISEEEVSRVVKKKLKCDCEILDFSLDLLGEWVGNCGDHAILKVSVKDSTELSFFVKLYPRVESIIEFIEWTGSFKKEIFIYELFDMFENEQIKLLLDCVPKCYLSIQKRFLILDDLAQQGYSTMNKHEVFDYNSIKVVLEGLAKFHASTLIYEEKKSCRLIDTYEEQFEESYFNDKPDFANKEGIGAAITGILNCIKLFDFHEKLLSGKDFREVLCEVVQRVFKLAKPSKTYRNVITHGDIWATNLLIKRDSTDKPVSCKLVDFQCARYTPPAQDVMSVIYLTTAREFRKKHMYNLIGIYYNCLEKHIALAGYDIKKILSFEDFFACCEEQKVFGMVQAAAYFPLILMKSEDAQDFFGDKERNKEALFVDRSALVKEQMTKNEKYRTRIYDSIQDLKDYCDYL